MGIEDEYVCKEEEEMAKLFSASMSTSGSLTLRGNDFPQIPMGTSS